jgi:hypothetical protein
MKAYAQSLTLAIFFISGCIQAQDPGTKNDVLVVKPTTDFEVSGKGTADPWKNTGWIELPKRKGVTDYRTRAKLLYSATGIYALFSCADKKITATMKEDFANLWTEDVVELFLWTDESIPLYFEYELSPLNYELSILVPNLDGNFLGWRPWNYDGPRKTRHATEIVKDSKGKTTEWLAEFFIPYDLLKPLRNVPPEKGTEWRINMYRIDYGDAQEYTSWSWKPVEKTFHEYRKFGVIRFD